MSTCKVLIQYLTYSKYLIHSSHHYYYCYSYFYNGFQPERKYIHNMQSFSVQKLWFCCFIANMCRQAPNQLCVLLLLIYVSVPCLGISLTRAIIFLVLWGRHLVNKSFLFMLTVSSVVAIQSSSSTDSLLNNMGSTITIRHI